MSAPTNFDIPESLDVVWDALHETEIEHTDPVRWDDVCLAMAWIAEALGIDPEDTRVIDP